MRAVVLCLLFSLQCVAAMAQDAPSEDGVGPYHFGMSIDAVRETSPNAAWQVQRVEEREALVGGPRVAVGRSRFNAVLLFEEGVLSRIILAGTSESACADVVPALVEELEPAYGAMRSAWAASEDGNIVGVRQTAAGSQVRLYESVGANVPSAHATQRRAAMFLHVSGLQNGALCNAGVAFSQNPQIAPEMQDLIGRLDASGDASAVPGGRVSWAERPTARDFMRNYPREALNRGVEGRAVLGCLILGTGRVECLVVNESPAGQGFGPAAVEIAHSFRADVEANPALVGQRTRIPIAFRLR